MNLEIFNNIDTLIAMSGSTLDLDEANTELITIKNSKKNKKNEIEDLQSIMTDARYFNASNELVDKNIEISLKNKINRFNRKLKEIKKNINTLNQEEIKLHEEITSLKKNIEENDAFIVTLEAKVKNNSTTDYYQELLKKEKMNYQNLKNELDHKNEEYENLIKELELNNQGANEINEKLDQEKNRLNDILDNLKNPNAYIDEELKENDNNKLNNLKEELEKLEKRELEILTDATMIGSDAKELIGLNDTKGALDKIKELVTIVKTKPYMDINNLEILNEELEKKESLRMELSSLIDNKSYDGLDNTAIAERVEYIDNKISKNKEKIAKKQEKIKEIDEFIANNLGIKITSLETEIKSLINTINEYKRMLKEKDKNAKTKANIENANIKKEKEKKILESILASYKEDLLNNMNETNTLSKEIQSLEEENNKIANEQTELNKLSLLDYKTKDIIEEEKDKEELRKVNEEMKAIKNRQKFDKTPDEIYDQIEMSLTLYKEPNKIETTRSEKNKNKTIEIDSLFDTPKGNEPITRFKVIEMIPAQTIKNTGGI